MASRRILSLSIVAPFLIIGLLILSLSTGGIFKVDESSGGFPIREVSGSVEINEGGRNRSSDVAGELETTNGTPDASTVVDATTSTSSNIAQVLAGGAERIEEFITYGGTSFNVDGAAILLADENFPKFVAAMTVNITPVEQQNKELAIQNILYAQQLTTDGSVVPHGTNCGIKFCLISMTAKDEITLGVFIDAVSNSNSSEVSIFSSVKVYSSSPSGIEGRLIFSTDDSLNSITIAAPAGSD